MKVISSNTFFAEQWLNFFIRSQPMPRHTLYHTIYPEQQGIPWLSFKSNLTRRHIHKRSTTRWQDQVSSRDQGADLGTRPSEALRRKMFMCVLSPHPINAVLMHDKSHRYLLERKAWILCCWSSVVSDSLVLYIDEHLMKFMGQSVPFFMGCPRSSSYI